MSLKPVTGSIVAACGSADTVWELDLKKEFPLRLYSGVYLFLLLYYCTDVYYQKISEILTTLKMDNVFSSLVKFARLSLKAAVEGGERQANSKII